MMYPITESFRRQKNLFRAYLKHCNSHRPFDNNARVCRCIQFDKLINGLYLIMHEMNMSRYDIADTFAKLMDEKNWEHEL